MLLPQRAVLRPSESSSWKLEAKGTGLCDSLLSEKNCWQWGDAFWAFFVAFER